jgi:hypothetical protein
VLPCARVGRLVTDSRLGTPCRRGGKDAPKKLAVTDAAITLKIACTATSSAKLTSINVSIMSASMFVLSFLFVHSATSRITASSSLVSFRYALSTQLYVFST